MPRGVPVHSTHYFNVSVSLFLDSDTGPAAHPDYTQALLLVGREACAPECYLLTYAVMPSATLFWFCSDCLSWSLQQDSTAPSIHPSMMAAHRNIIFSPLSAAVSCWQVTVALRGQRIAHHCPASESDWRKSCGITAFSFNMQTFSFDTADLWQHCHLQNQSELRVFDPKEPLISAVMREPFINCELFSIDMLPRRRTVVREIPSGGCRARGRQSEANRLSVTGVDTAAAYWLSGSSGPLKWNGRWQDPAFDADPTPHPRNMSLFPLQGFYFLLRHKKDKVCVDFVFIEGL